MKKRIALLLVICICVSLVGCKSSDYKMGMDLFGQKQYTAALILFENLGDYKNSTQMVQECKYNSALELFNNGNYIDALTAFEELGTYQNSAAGNKSSDEMVKECKYNLACMLFASDDFEAARLAFQELGEYRDSSEMVSVCEHYLDPVNVLLAYIDENSTYIPAIEEEGLEIRVENEPTTVLVNNGGNLEFVYVVGSPVVDWDPMDLMEFANYRMPDKLDAYEIGEYMMNYAELHVKMDTEKKIAECTIDYIEVDKSNLRPAKGSVAFDYASYDGKTSSFNFIDGFNTDSQMFSKRGQVLLNCGLIMMAEMLYKCDGEFSLIDLGWEALG